MLISGIIHAQDKFFCQKVYDDINLCKSLDANNLKWAKNILEAFPLSSNGYISYNYTLEASDSNTDISRTMEVTHNWLKSILKSENSIKSIDKEKHQYICKLNYGIIGQQNGFSTISRITADIDCKIEIYEHNIIIRLRVKHYSLIGFNAFKGGDNSLVSVKAVYPVTDDPDYRRAFAQAFINCNANCMQTVIGYLQYLNNHYDVTNDDEDW